MLPYNRNLKDNSKALRKNMTPEERHLWYDFLKRLPMQVHRQYRIEGYIVDFYIASLKIVIELDGIQHESYEGREKDAERDKKLGEWGITVLRYTNESIRNSFTAIATDILNHIGITFADLK